MSTMAAEPLNVPRSDETARVAIRRADRGRADNGPLTASLAECLIARYGDEKPRDPTARLMLVIARKVAPTRLPAAQRAVERPS